MLKLKSLFFCCGLTLLTGCMTGPTTPEERERAKEVLEETAPRNLNEQPKAIPMFKYNLPDVRP